MLSARFYDILGVAGQPLPFASSVDLTHDARGRLTGAGTTILVIGTDSVAADYKASGRVSGGGTTTRATLVTRFKGSGVISGLATTFNISVRYKVEVDQPTGSLVGTARGEAKIAKFEGGTIKSDIVTPIPAGMNGSWTLQLNVTPLKKLAGTGSIILSNARTLPGNLSGSYSPRSNEAKLHFSGIDEGKGSSLNVKFATNEGVSQLLSLRGKAFGQTLRQ
jgi:hypothetical protein